MKTGINYFAFKATTGGLPSGGLSGWTVTSQVAGVSAQGYSSLKEYDSGIYAFGVNLSGVGEGFVTVINNNPSVVIDPAAYSTDVFAYSTDDVYSVANRTVYTGATTLVNAYETVNVGAMKAGDDYELAMTIDPAVASTLVGWTDFKATMRKSEALTSSSSAYLIGDWTIVNVNTGTSTVSMQMSGGFTLNVIPEGSSSISTYSDLQAVNPSGLKKTLTQISATITRNFTS